MDESQIKTRPKRTVFSFSCPASEFTHLGPTQVSDLTSLVHARKSLMLTKSKGRYWPSKEAGVTAGD